MSFSQDTLKRLSTLPVHSGFLVQDERPSTVTCIVKLPLQEKMSNKQTYSAFVSYGVDTSYAALAFEEGVPLFSLQISLQSSLGEDSLFSRTAWKYRASCPLDLRQEEVQNLFPVLLRMSSLDIIVVADNQEHTVLLRHNAPL